MEPLELRSVDGQPGGLLAGAPWAHDPTAVAAVLEVDPESGLTGQEAAERLARFGPNVLQEAPVRPGWRILLDQLLNPIAALLIVATAVSLVFDKGFQAIAIVMVLVLNVGIGFITELRATRSMEALRNLSRTRARVLRDGQTQVVDAAELVPGDTVLIEAGEMPGADLRLVKASRLLASEASLTGESVPVAKDTSPCSPTAPLGERSPMLFRGTAITQGDGKGIVTATGLATELGYISALTQAAEGEITPLEKRLAELGRKMVWVVLGLAGIIGLKGWIMGLEPYLLIETAIALAVAAIPEGLPVVATLALAKGMWRMAEQKAVMRRLSAVETLGATSIVCTDKTGTLTENRMQVASLSAIGPGGIPLSLEVQGRDVVYDGGTVALDGHPGLERLLLVGLLCNKAQLDNGFGHGHLGDPMEISLQELGHALGTSQHEVLREFPEVRGDAFDPKRAMMATWHQHDDGVMVAVKGAPEAVMAASTHVYGPQGLLPLDESLLNAWNAANRQLAADGLRVLAAACRQAQSADEEPYANLALVGLFAFMDPPREGVAEALAQMRQAGIEVVMITGDQPLTAKNIGLTLGIVESPLAPVLLGSQLRPPQDMDAPEKSKVLATRIFSRVSPEQKLQLIDLFQQQGAVVAMTGDGVNDAPALKKADIGIAMGIRGTDVAKDAADVVLADDRFETIVAAVRQGRIIFGNIRRFILYLLSGNAAAVLMVAIAILLGSPLPLLPLQLLFLNMLSDVFPALALGVGKGDNAVLRRPPRPAAEPLLTRNHWWAVAGYGVVIAAVGLTAFLVSLRALGLPPERAITVAFLTLAFCRLWHVFNMRDVDSAILVNGVTRNPWVWAALGFCITLLLVALYVPSMASVLSLTRPTAVEWQVVLFASLVPLFIGQAVSIVIGAIRYE